ncbi:hypothetical protein BURCENBC7_AP4072 [Burkholderia cenocepacia BC7]|nr:hypothetical protein BURCENK562V_C5323 [Burkholderia cenocepacia K56-2Valvano]ERI29505.1 hypothetical protein BURCENBC7_AP4072 [Burkholderia cenocepacia BC7]
MRHLDLQALFGLESRFLDPPAGQLHPQMENGRRRFGEPQARKDAASLERLV